jgi:hypothetical protein
VLRFHRKVIILDYNTVFKAAPLPVLKLPVDWPATKVTVRGEYELRQFPRASHHT